MVGFTMSRLSAGGIDWRYARRGEGPTVLLLHTLRTQADYFAALVRHLDDYDFVVPDLPGHGESSAPRLEYSASFFRDAVAALIDKLGLSRVVVVGESIGAVVGLSLAAATNPSVVGVVALNPYDYGVRGGIRRSSVLANIVFTAMLVPGIGSVVARAAPPPLLRLIMQGGVEDSANLANDFVGTLFRSGLRRGHARAFRSLCLEWRSWVDAREWYGGIEVPVWLGYSEADWSRPLERQANRDLMPTATYVDLGAAGHFSCLEVPAVVAATVRDAVCAAALQLASTDGPLCGPRSTGALCLSIGREMVATNRRMPMHVGRATRVHLHQLTRWVLRTARLRAPATQPMKRVAREGRGTSYAALAVGSGGS